jgi:hypothetical protein
MLDILNGTIELGEKLFNILVSLKGQIKGDKSAAAKDLQLVIDEIIKFYKITQGEISNFQSIDFTDSGNLAANKKILFDIQSGEMNVRISEASGSCAKIKRIYNSHLDSWFLQVFHNENQNYVQVQHLFKQLSDYDFSMIEATKDLEKYLQPKANSFLSMLLVNDTNNLIAAHSDVTKELMNVRVKLSQVIKQLVDIKNEFQSIANTI